MKRKNKIIISSIASIMCILSIVIILISMNVFKNKKVNKPNTNKVTANKTIEKVSCDNKNSENQNKTVVSENNDDKKVSNVKNEAKVSKTDEGDEKVDDSMIISSVTNAYDAFEDITSRIMVSDNIFKIDNNYYVKLPKQYDSYDKLLKYLSKTWSKDCAAKIIKYIQADSRNGAYSILVGQEGEGFDLKNINVISKKVSQSKIEAYIKTKYQDGDECKYKVVIIKENGKYYVDYFQYIELLFGR